MCGIAGFALRYEQAQLATVQAMCDRIRHRGPDDEGFHVDGGCALGMRRLSIIDLSTGHQPICNEDGTIWIVFNGEIYDFQRLRDDLIARGHRFSTHSDTETIIHLYEEEGVAGIDRLRGMFAFAIWDARKRELVLARDRFGKKPLFYALLPEGLYFGSELSSLREAGVPLEMDREALRLYFQFSYIPDPFSAFKSVRKLAPGSWMIYRPETDAVQQGKYWSVPAPAEEPSGDFSEDEACAQIREVFDESVRIRMLADVPLGAFLSGGIDSSFVVASMAIQSKEPVKTFSIGFDEADFNELEYAALVANKYRTDHHEILVRPDSAALVTKLVQHFGEPFGDSSAIPTFAVSEFAARHVKVALSGDGGDELFAGYESFLAVQRLEKFDRVPQGLRSVVSWVAERLPYSAYGKNYLRMVSRPSALARYFEYNYMPYFLRQRLLTPDWMLPADAGFLARTLSPCLLPNGASALSQALYFEETSNLTGDMLVKVDRMSMANSLEVRCPMLDHKLAELAAKIPHAWKLRGGQGKAILLKALGERLPPQLLSRSKMGFGVPLSHWFRGSLRGFLRDHLGSRRFLDRGIVSPPFVQELLNEHDTKRRDNSHRLWALLVLELWWRDLEESGSAIPAISSRAHNNTRS